VKKQQKIRESAAALPEKGPAGTKFIAALINQFGRQGGAEMLPAGASGLGIHIVGHEMP
jgi:hypothetical protein